MELLSHSLTSQKVCIGMVHDHGALRTTNNLKLIGSIVLGVSLVLWIVFTSVGLFNVSPVFFLQPSLFSFISLILLFCYHSSHLSFDHSTRTFTVKAVKAFPCLGGVMAMVVLMISCKWRQSIQAARKIGTFIEYHTCFKKWGKDTSWVSERFHIYLYS